MKKKFVLLALIIAITFILFNMAPYADEREIYQKENKQIFQKKPKEQKKDTFPKKENNQDKYSIEQAISDNTQLNTLAFSALGFITGTTCSDSFLPPGKVADFFGFQYLRDTTQAGKGHSTDFVTYAANNVLHILNETQKVKMIALAKSQSSLVNEFAYKRFPIMVAFRRQLELEEDIPLGSSGLSKLAVIQYSANIYELDAKISLQRAQLFGEIISSLDSGQIAYLDKMIEGGFASWPALKDQIDKKVLAIASMY